MKNIHIIPTDKPSRLVKFFTNKFHLCKEILPIQDEEQYQNIYIPSDEVPKLDEWGINTKNNVIYKDKGFVPTGYEEVYCRKIILTTDQDLDGVQAIDDEFLEWFVTNPSCEEVKVETINNKWHNEDGNIISVSVYKIIIPKEEPKQETTADYIDRHIVESMVEVAKQKMYSEEEVKEAFDAGLNYMKDGRLNKKQWFEKFKKK